MVAALLLTLWGIWFFWGRITVWAVSETARAEVRDEVFSVQAPVEARVVAVHIERGQEVRHGDLLIELETFQQEGQRDRTAADLRGLRAQESELNNQINRERSALDLWLNGHRARVAEATSALQKAESAAAHAGTEEARTRKLHADELTSRGELDAAVSRLEQAEAEVQQLQASVERIDGDRDLQATERRNTIAKLIGDLGILQSSIAAKESQMDSLGQEVELRKIAAPADGTLAGVTTLREGAVVEVGDVLARIVPSGQIGAYALFRPADAVGRIRNGQNARMRVDGFPSTQFGTVPATVTVVDREATDGRIRVDFAIAEGRPRTIDLQHGMVGSIEVEVERLSPAAMLLRAVGKLLDRPSAVASESLADTD